MGQNQSALIATCWTTAGDVRPDHAGNLSRWRLEDRIEAAARAGYDGPYGVEILSDAFRAVPFDEAARRSFDTAAAFCAIAPGAAGL